MVGEPGGHRQHRLVHRAELPGGLEAAVAPGEPEAQGVVEVGARRAAERPAGTGVGRDAVDVVEGQAGVGDGALGGLDGEVEPAAVEAAPDVGLADPGNHGSALEGLTHRRSGGRRLEQLGHHPVGGVIARALPGDGTVVEQEHAVTQVEGVADVLLDDEQRAALSRAAW